MTPLLTLVVHTTLLTFAAVMLGAYVRNREWTLEGLKVGFGNRDDLPEPTPLGARAERAAVNSIEGAVCFVPLALTAEIAGLGMEALLGAQVYFWARVAYLPVYWAGIPYLRSVIWLVGIVGLAFMVLALL